MRNSRRHRRKNERGIINVSMKKISLFLLMMIAVFIPLRNISAEMTDISVPKPIGDFIESLKEIDVDNIGEKISGNISFDDSVVTQKLSDAGIEEIWNAVNGWMEETIGISLGQIIGGIGNFIMWILETALGLLKGGMNELGA